MKKNVNDFEMGFYEGIIKESPGFIQALILLGDIYTRRGLYKEGLEVDLKLSGLRPYDETVFYNLACDYSLLKKSDESFDALKKAIQLGYRDFMHMQKDDDLGFLRKDPRFKRLIESVRQMEKLGCNNKRKLYEQK